MQWGKKYIEEKLKKQFIDTKSIKNIQHMNEKYVLLRLRYSGTYVSYRFQLPIHLTINDSLGTVFLLLEASTRKEKFYWDCIHKLSARWGKCVASDGHYL